MADISKCANYLCPFKDNCYRFTAPASEFWQSYGNFKPYVNENEDLVCDYYWKIKTKKNDDTITTNQSDS
jgi:hypothetical protein